MKQHLCVLFLVTVFLSFGLVYAAEDAPELRDDQVIHTTVQRVSGEPRSLEELGEITAENEAHIAELQDRLMQCRQHPEEGPPFENLVVPQEDLVPHNPPTSPEGIGLDAGDVVLYVNSNASDPAPVSWRSEVAEPAVAASGDRVFYSANWLAASSSNGGTDFSFVNPDPGPFAAPTGEVFCCDQTMAHDPGSNTIFWLQQFIPNGGTNTGTQRINVDQDADGDWDCAYDINTLLVGFYTNTWFDFPDLTVSSNYLYHSSNTFTYSNGWAGGYAGRYPLSELAACEQELTIDAFTSSYGSFRFSRGADDTMYFAAQPNNASLRIWTWTDAGATPVAVTKSITSWMNASRQCPGPDGRNWCGFHDGRIQGGFVTGSTLGFTWTPSQGGGFAFPYMRISTFDTESSLDHIEDIDVWSPDIAYMYPSVEVNSLGELGGTVMWGGGEVHYASCSAWMAETPTEAGFVPLNHAISIAGNNGPSNGNSRSGDYTMTTVYYPDDTQFAGACFAYLALGSSSMNYVRFGTDAGPEIFADDFEGGNTNSWSFVAP